MSVNHVPLPVPRPSLGLAGCLALALLPALAAAEPPPAEGLDAAVRWDLEHATVVPSVPPELAGTAAPVDLGGTLASIGLVTVIEW